MKEAIHNAFILSTHNKFFGHTLLCKNSKVKYEIIRDKITKITSKITEN